jgi:hypothetical protein
VCGSIEEKILQRQMQKADMASVYFDANGGERDGGNSKSAIQISAKELRDVFRIPGDLTKCAAGTVQFARDYRQQREKKASKKRLRGIDSESESDDDDASVKKKMWYQTMQELCCRPIFCCEALLQVRLDVGGLE